MYAVVITVGIEPGKADEATAILHNQVVPDAKATAGFVSGTWARSEDGTNGHSLLLFENEETAKAALAQVKQQGPPPGAPVKILYAEMYEVLAQA
jgi:quinol monooxygenase YgiN